MQVCKLPIPVGLHPGGGIHEEYSRSGCGTAGIAKLLQSLDFFLKSPYSSHNIYWARRFFSYEDTGINCTSLA
jgi:hypothetical protein